MKLYLDSANIEAIRKYNDIFFLDGVTTNPSIICKEERDFETIIKEICEMLSPEQTLFVQVLASEVDDIIKEAKWILKIRENTVPKIPVTENGLKAIKLLHEEGIETLATAIHDSMQGLMAARNGAAYLAPYYNRMSKYSDSFSEISLLQETIENYGLNAIIVGAGFHELDEIKDCISTGVSALTLNPKMMELMYKHVGSDLAVSQFEDAWQNQYGRKTLI